MKKKKHIISLFIAFTAVFCLATLNVSAITFLHIDTQFGAVAFPIMIQPHIVAVGKPSNGNAKKEKPDHSDKKGETPSSSTQNSTATSSSSSQSTTSSESASSVTSSALPTSSIVNSTPSSESNASLLLFSGICFIVGLGFTVLAFMMHKRNKKKAQWLDETCEIRINQDIQQPEDTDKDKK